VLKTEIDLTPEDEQKSNLFDEAEKEVGVITSPI